MLFFGTAAKAQNYSLSFDGVDDYIFIGDIADYDIQDALTISVWVKPNSIQTNTIIDRTADIYGTNGGAGLDGYNLSLRSQVGTGEPDQEGAVYASFGPSSGNDFAISPPNSYMPNEWIHITGVWKNNNYVKLYINGVLISQTSTNYSFNTDKPLEFARTNYGNYQGSYLHGNIDEVMIWNNALDLFLGMASTGSQ